MNFEITHLKLCGGGRVKEGLQNGYIKFSARPRDKAFQICFRDGTYRIDILREVSSQQSKV